MFYRESSFNFPDDIQEGELNIVAIHFSNEILVQIRLDGELDSTYEVNAKGLRGIGQGFVAGHSYFEDDDDDDAYTSSTGHMSDYQVITKLGDSNNIKLHVVCTQIAELYEQVILPKNVDGMGSSAEDGVSSRNILITLSSKIWKDDSNDKDFNKLVYILQKIKQIYE